eukprot:CAMPEP_0115014980 /NCGR_PEP_ID=MMETSP0216-20121206/26449_1 /TAXON_ID=223996 /ORGANISM="Protocruzia adherens, Strain Boccale" /LENGTH=429 /DNA_ID=CAMNT_0002384919 /DNA_START=61 /DNA_END=1351 /DNA_ORIENTATION=+
MSEKAETVQVSKPYAAVSLAKSSAETAKTTTEKFASPFPGKRSYVYPAVIGAIYLLWIILDIIFEDDFQKSSHSVAEDMQNEDIKVFFLVVTQIITTEVAVCVFLLLPLFFRTDLALYTTMTMTFVSGYLTYYLKMVYRRPRPFQADSSIEPLDSCTFSMGMPSGHSSGSVAILLYTPFLLIFHFSRPLGEATIQQRRRIFIALGGFSCLAFLVAFSRLFLGMHSWNQILLGLLMATFVLTLWHSIGGYEMAMNEYLNPTVMNVKKLLQCEAFFFTFIVLACITYPFLESWDPPSEWIQNMLVHCKDLLEDETEKFQHFQHKHFIDTSICFAVCGGILGYYLSLVHLKKPMNWWQVPWKYKVLMALIMAVVALIPAALFLFIIPRDSVGVAYILEALGFFSLGLIIYLLYPVLGDKIRNRIEQETDAKR